MAARLNPKQDDRTRSAIRTSQLVNRLELFALGDPDPISKKPFVMSKDQVAAATALLRKTLPDLTSTTISGTEDGAPVKLSLSVGFVGSKPQP